MRSGFNGYAERTFFLCFSRNMIDGIKENKIRMESYVEKSPTLVTLLNPYIVPTAWRKYTKNQSRQK